MASATVRQTNSGNSGGAQSTSYSASMPANSVDAGNLLILLVSHKDVTSGQVSVAGWTRFFEALNAGGSTAGLTGFCKLADGTEDGTNVTVTSAVNTRWAHVSASIDGAADPGTTLPEAATVTVNNTSAPNPPSLTPTGGAQDYLFLAAFASSHGRIIDVTGANGGLPAGYTLVDGSGDNGGAATHPGIGVAQKATTGATTEDPSAFDTTGTTVEETASATIAIYPAPTGGGGQTLSPGAVTSSEAVRGTDLTQSGPVALAAGKVASGAALRGTDLTSAGPTALALGKVATGAAVRGADLAGAVLALPLGHVPSGAAMRGADVTQSGPAALALGKVPPSAALRGVDVAQSGPIALALGKVASAAAVRGADVASGGTAALALGHVPSGQALRGVDLAAGSPTVLALGKVATAAAVRGADLAQSGPVALGLGKVPSGFTVRGVSLHGALLTLTLGKVAPAGIVRGVNLGESGTTALNLGKIAGAGAVRGVDTSQSGPVVLLLGRLGSGVVVYGVLLSGPTKRGVVALVDTATASAVLVDLAPIATLAEAAPSAALVDTAPDASLDDAPTGSVALSEIPT